MYVEYKEFCPIKKIYPTNITKKPKKYSKKCYDFTHRITMVIQIIAFVNLITFKCRYVKIEIYIFILWVVFSPIELACSRPIKVVLIYLLPI